MRRVLALACLIATPLPLAAGVLECDLADREEARGGELRIYSFEGVTHSALLEFTTDYGDRLPFLFSCGVNCVMELVDDDYRYLLSVSPSPENPERVVLITEGDKDFRQVEHFEVESCEVTVLEGLEN